MTKKKKRGVAISDPAGRGRKQSSRAKRRGFYSKPREEQNPRRRRGFYFVCPKHGRIPRDEVIFLCNTCDPKKIVREILVEKGMYLCPQCLQPGENFECFLCHSTEVEMREYGKKHS